MVDKCFLIILDGPPASGKSTISYKIASVSNINILNYKSFGILNFISKILIIQKYIKNFKYIVKLLEKEEYDPFLIASKYIVNFPYLMVVLLEIIYKLLQQLNILVFIFLRRILIIDEFVILRMANYLYVLRRGLITPRGVKILFAQDILFITIIANYCTLKYIYIENDLRSLKLNWKKRGQRTDYNTEFFVLVKMSFNFLYNLLSYLNIKINIVTPKSREVNYV